MSLRMQIDQPHLGMPNRDYYISGRDEKALIAYQKFAVNIATLLGAPPERAENDMREVVDFEILLANVSI